MNMNYSTILRYHGTVPVPVKELPDEVSSRATILDALTYRCAAWTIKVIKHSDYGFMQIIHTKLLYKICRRWKHIILSNTRFVEGG